MRNLLVTLCRVLIVYTVLLLCRLAFYAVNAGILGPLSWYEAPALLTGAWTFDTVSLVYSNGLFVLLSLLPFRFRNARPYQKVLFWLFTLVNSVNIVLNLSDAVYFHYAKKRFTADEFHFTGNDNNASILLKAASENLWLVLYGLLLIAGMVWLYRQTRRIPVREARSNAVFYGLNTLVLLGAVVLMVGGVRGGFKRTTRPITLSNATQYVDTPQKASLILSNPFCVLRTLGNKPVDFPAYFEEPELSRLFTPIHRPDLSETLSPAPEAPLKRKNVVVFILESFSREHSGRLNPGLYPEGETYTPFLDSLMGHSYVLTNAYANGRKSIEALPSVWASIPSFATPFVLLPQSVGEMRPLPRLLDEEGYHTAFFCGSPRGSMGFAAFAKLAGIRHAYSQEDYEARHGRDDFDGYWGVWDEPFLQYMGEMLSEFPRPFFAGVFTLSSHHPFVVPDFYKDSLPKGHTRIHRNVAYTDLALRRFFEYAKTQDWYENTIFVFAADHVSSEVYADRTKAPTGNFGILSFLYTPDGQVYGEDGSVSQQLDLMPTVLGLLGYDKPYFAFGRDLLREPERLPMAANYIDGAYQVITDSLAFFFDGKRIIRAYDYKRDPLEKHDLADPSSPYQQRMDSLIKAYFQQYYRHIERKEYLPE